MGWPGEGWMHAWLRHISVEAALVTTSLHPPALSSGDAAISAEPAQRLRATKRLQTAACPPPSHRPLPPRRRALRCRLSGLAAPSPPAQLPALRLRSLRVSDRSSLPSPRRGRNTLGPSRVSQQGSAGKQQAGRRRGHAPSSPRAPERRELEGHARAPGAQPPAARHPGSLRV